MQKPLKAFPTQDHDAHIAAHVAFMSTRMVQINPQVYSALQAHISEHVSLKAQGEVGAMVQEDPKFTTNVTTRSRSSKIRMECYDCTKSCRDNYTTCTR